MLLFLPFWGRTQRDSLDFQMVILNAADSSLVAYILTPGDTFKLPVSCLRPDGTIILDSLMAQNYIFEYDQPYYGPIIDLTNERIRQIVPIGFLACDDIGAFLNRSGMKFYFLHYGYTTYSDFNELREKYGVIVMNEGCVVHHQENDYMKRVYRLLDIRNGVDWHARYRADHKCLEQEKLNTFDIQKTK